MITLPNYLQGYTIEKVVDGTIYFNKRKKQIIESELVGIIDDVQFCKTEYNKLAVARVMINHKRYSCYEIKSFKNLTKGNNIIGTVREYEYKNGRTIKNIKIRGGLNGKRKSDNKKNRPKNGKASD